MRQSLGIHCAPRQHWAGDGFPVRTMLSHHDQGAHISPFITLDYAGQAKFEPTIERRGDGQHPHVGIETVTIVYDGEVEHRDSTSAGGGVGPHDVQWMTAGSDIYMRNITRRPSLDRDFETIAISSARSAASITANPAIGRAEDMKAASFVTTPESSGLRTSTGAPVTPINAPRSSHR